MNTPTPTGIFVKLTLMAFFFAANMIAGRILSPVADALPLSAVRYTMAFLLMSSILFWHHYGSIPLPRGWRQWFGVIASGLFGVCGFSFFFFKGIETVGAMRAALIVALAPPIVAVAEKFFFGAAMGRYRAAGITICFLGGMLVVSDGVSPMVWLSSAGAGVFYMIACVVCWSIFSLLGRHLLSEMPTLPTIWICALFGTVALVVLTVCLSPGLSTFQLSATHWALLAGIAVFGTGLPYIWYYQGIHAIGAGRASCFLNLVPAFACILGLVFLSEWPSIWQWLGAALIIPGLFLVNLNVREPIFGPAKGHGVADPQDQEAGRSG